MRDFDFQNETKILFGKGKEDSVGAECAEWGKKVLLHYGGGSIKKSGLYDKVTTSLKRQGLDVVELGGVKPNPRLSLVQEGIELCRKEGVDMILAVGGGSVIDSAKAIGIGFYYDGNVWDFYEGKAEAKKMLPLGTILTIPAAGSETSGSSVITYVAEQRKYGLTNMVMRPRFSILNPEWTFSLPDYQTACGVSDMLAHVMERYFSTATDVELTDRMCEAVMKTIIHRGRQLAKTPDDYQARAEIMWSGTIAHNDLLNTGRGGDWSSHQIEHEISAISDVAHGAGLSIVFPAWMKYVYKTNTQRFIRFAHEVLNVDYNYENPEETILTGIAELERFYKDMNLPVRLSDIDMDSSKNELMAERVTNKNSNKIGEFLPLDQNAVKAILDLAV